MVKILSIGWKIFSGSFFFGDRLKKFFEDLFFSEHLRLCPWSLASSIPVLGLESVYPRKNSPWPRLFVYVATSLVSSTPPLLFTLTLQRRWSPRGQNLKSLALVSKVKSLASNPASPRKWPVLGSRIALFFVLLKMGQDHEQCCFVLEHARELAEIFLTLEFYGKFANFWAKTFFFFSFLEIACFLRKLSKNFERRPCFKNTSSLCFGPWTRPREILSSEGVS